MTVWGLASPGEGTYVILALVCMPQKTRSVQMIASLPPYTPFMNLAKARRPLHWLMVAINILKPCIEYETEMLCPPSQG